MIDVRQERVLEYVLVTPRGEATKAFRDLVARAGAALELKEGAPVVDGRGKPVPSFLNWWRLAWNRPDAFIPPAMVLFTDRGKFTAVGLARWVAATQS